MCTGLPLPPLISLLWKNPFPVEPTFCLLCVWIWASNYGWRPRVLARLFQSKWRMAGASSPPVLSGSPSVFSDLTPTPSLQKYSFTYFLSLQKSSIITPLLRASRWPPLPRFFFPWGNKQERITFPSLHPTHQLQAFVFWLVSPVKEEWTAPFFVKTNFPLWVEYQSSPHAQNYLHSLTSSEFPLSIGPFLSRC